MIGGLYTWLLISSAQMCVDVDFKKPCQEWAYQCLLDNLANKNIDKDGVWEICAEDSEMMKFYKELEPWVGQ